jgi:hypothetical protein
MTAYGHWVEIPASSPHTYFALKIKAAKDFEKVVFV